MTRRRSERSYQREIRRLHQLLAMIEWVQPTYNGSPSCSSCGEQQHFGHAVGCELAAVLGRPTGVPDGEDQ